VYDNGVLLALPTIHANSLGYWTTTITPATSAATHTVTTTQIDPYTHFVGLPSAATTLTIAYPPASVAATTPAGNETPGPPIGCTITRALSFSDPIVVNLTWGGTATFGASGDYTVTTSAGSLSSDGKQLTLGTASSATLTVTPVDDSISE